MGLGVTSIEVIGNLAVGRLAELEARREVWGATGEVLDEFFTLDGETPDGQTLFDILKQGHLQKERVKKKESEYHGPPKDE